jgi:hypothetical protein
MPKNGDKPVDKIKGNEIMMLDMKINIYPQVIHSNKMLHCAPKCCKWCNKIVLDRCNEMVQG